MAPSVTQYTLAIICLAQFLLIMKLISINQHQMPLIQTTTADTVLSEAAIVPTSQSAVQTGTSPKAIASTNYEGVAVTAFLDMPKWYARRYTMMVQNIANNLPDNWIIQIFYTGRDGSQMGLDLNPGIQRFIENGKVILTLMPREYHKMRRMHLMLQPWFWSNMLADKVLMFGGGSVICSNSKRSLNEFVQYDYLGSPWGNFKGMGGEGGTSIQAISIRNRKLMLQALEYAMLKIENPKDREKAYKDWGLEDIFYLETLIEMKKKGLINVNIAPKEVTYQFAAIGSYANESVLVATGTLPDVEYSIRDTFLQFCPEMKFMYPSLHDPNCFGASPNGEECAKSICALKPKEERPSGC